jgi:hypothetical protein
MFRSIPLLLCGVLGILALPATVRGHDSTGQYTQCLQTQRNERGGECCNGQDTIFLDDNQWRTAGDHYQVFYGSAWHDVPSWALSTTKENITGKAVLWLWRGEPVCFKPAFFF